MSGSPTLHDLHVLIVALDGKVDCILSHQNVTKEWQKTHESTDDRRFERLHKYAATIALAALGTTLKYIFF